MENDYKTIRKNILNLATHLKCHHIFNSLIINNNISRRQTSLFLIQQHFIQQATMFMKSLFTNPNPNHNPNPNPNSITLLVTLAIKSNQIIHS